MRGMTEELWAIINAWREKGVAISDDEAEQVRQLCVRKMDITGTENPDEYLPMLYADEVKWKLVAFRGINSMTDAMKSEAAYV